MRTACLISLLCTLLTTGAVHARVPLGEVAATFPHAPSKVLADPLRPRVYAADPSTNSVIVLDTETLKVLATIPAGANPMDLAISEDNTTLYVANADTAATAISVVDLGSLTVRNSFALPGPALAIAAGSGGRLYASTNLGANQSEICQLDANSGVVQTTFNPGSYINDFLQISPDGRTLFSAGQELSPNVVMSFDVSTGAPSLLQTNRDAGDLGLQLVLSHSGKYLCFPCDGGNSQGDSTDLLSATDIFEVYGRFNNEDYPGPLAFSPDDGLVYLTVGGGGGDGMLNALQVYDIQTLLKVGEASFPAVGSSGYPDTITSIVADNTGSYLFIGASALEVTPAGTSYQAGKMLVVGTGVGPLSPRPPQVDVTATVPFAVVSPAKAGEFTLTLSTDAINDVKVLYRFTGTAVNGTDYSTVPQSAVVHPGHTTKVIKIVPRRDSNAASRRTVGLTILPGSGYVVGRQAHAKVTIVKGGSE